MKQFRLQMLVAFLVLLIGTALIGFLYIMSNKEIKTIKPGIVLSKPSPVAAPVKLRTNALSTPFVAQQIHHESMLPNVLHYPSTTPITSTTKSLWTTSNAKVTIVNGSGWNGINHSTTYPQQKRQGVKQTTATMPMTTFIAMASAREVASPGATAAPQMAVPATAPRRAPGPPTPDGPLDKENQLVEQPIGNSWILLIFAIVYLLIAARKREKGIENAR